MRQLWTRLVAFGFRLLYNELARLYDPVSWLASLGHWRRWQRSIWAHLPARGLVLEVGTGPGHLLLDLAAAGHRPVGLDLSPAMLGLARRRLQRLGHRVRLCRGRAAALPFAAHSFAAIAITFPTAYVYDPVAIGHLARVLRPGGRLIVVEMAVFVRRDPGARLLEGLYRLTGQRGPAPDLAQLLAAAGFAARHHEVQVSGSRVSLVVADKPLAEHD